MAPALESKQVSGACAGKDLAGEFTNRNEKLSISVFDLGCFILPFKDNWGVTVSNRNLRQFFFYSQHIFKSLRFMVQITMEKKTPAVIYQ